jgi:hypothetical protein
MLRKLSYLALAALLSFAPLIGSAQLSSDSTKVNRTYKTGTTKVMHHKRHGKAHTKTTKKAVYKVQRNKSTKPNGTY